MVVGIESCKTELLVKSLCASTTSTPYRYAPALRNTGLMRCWGKAVSRLPVWSAGRPPGPNSAVQLEVLLDNGPGGPETILRLLSRCFCW